MFFVFSFPKLVLGFQYINPEANQYISSQNNNIYFYYLLIWQEMVDFKGQSCQL